MPDKTGQEDRIERSMPDIRWRSPLRVTVMGTSDTRLCCRFCIAMHGLKAADVKIKPKTLEDFCRHLKEVHGRDAELKEERKGDNEQSGLED